MDVSISSGFYDEPSSPIISRPKRRAFTRPKTPILPGHSHQHIYETLLLHLRSKVQLTRDQLRQLEAQLARAEPAARKERWVLLKARGILSYILKKRRDFTEQLVSGEVTLYAGCAPEDSDSFQLSLLTNANFVMEAENKPLACSTPLPPPYSESDMFASQFPANGEDQTEDSLIFKVPDSQLLSTTVTGRLELDEVNNGTFVEYDYEKVEEDLRCTSQILKDLIDEIQTALENFNLVQETVTQIGIIKPTSFSLPVPNDPNYKLLRESCEEFKRNLSHEEFQFIPDYCFSQD